jgi:hypothetical protein
MKKLFPYLIVLAALGVSGFALPAQAADMNLWCLTGTGSNGQPIWQPASSANPCPTTSSGGGGGSVTQGTVPWADDITQWANVALGSPSNYGTSPGAVAVPGVNAFVTNSVAVTGTFFQATQPVSVSQATPGTTNGTAIVGVNAATALAGAGATGAGSLRDTVAQDPTTIAGSAPGTAGAPSANVITTQGAARTSVSSTSYEANHVITGSAGSLYSFEVQADSTLSAAAWYIMIYNATTAPADGSVTPIKCYQMPSGTLGANYAFPNPIAFSAGIVIGVSTTGCLTKTASAHAFISGDF